MDKSEKKKWEPPKIEDLSVQKTEGGYTTGEIEIGVYYQTSIIGPD